MDTPCIEVLDNDAEVTDVVSAAELIDLIIQDDEVGMRILEDIAAHGDYEFSGDGFDDATDQTFRVTDDDAFRTQLQVLQDSFADD